MGRKNRPLVSTGLAEYPECPVCGLPVLNKKYLMLFLDRTACVSCTGLAWAEAGKDPRPLEKRAKKLHQFRQKQLSRLESLTEKLCNGQTQNSQDQTQD